MKCESSQLTNLMSCTCLWILSGCRNDSRCTLDTVATSTTILLYVSWMVSPSSTGVSWNLKRMLFPTKLTSRLCSTNSRTSWYIRLSTSHPFAYTMHDVTTIWNNSMTVKKKFVPVLNQAPQHEDLGLWQSRYTAPYASNLSIRCSLVGRFITVPCTPWKRAATAQWTRSWLVPELNKMLY